MPRRPHSSLSHAPLAPVAAALRTGSLPVDRHVIEACDRLDAFDHMTRALLPEEGRRERLLREAATLTAQYPDIASRPPLYGVLVGVKDIIAVTGMPTRAGSALPPEAFPLTEGPAVRRLRAAGALILGKTVTTEFAYFDPGATTNPHDPRRTPGGSSSGSAAAVAAGFALVALGTQTVGSVIRPAAFCGVVGVKPTYGRIPTDGALYYSPSVDHIGFFTQDAAGAQIVGSVLIDDWRTGISMSASITLGVPDGRYLAQAEPAALQAFETSLRALEASGITVLRIPALTDIEAVNRRHRALSTAEFREQHLERFARWGSLVRGASASLFDDGAAVTAAERAEGFAGREGLRRELEALMDAHGIDAWVSPAATGPAPIGLRSTGDPAMNLPWTHTGMPAVTLPAGRVDSMPVGVQVVGRRGHDEELLALAEVLEPVL
ncbi:MAG: amidase [Dehalococcoidia bacterium]|nr:MAG: amidase [Dehalococcoidia bacterium]